MFPAAEVITITKEILNEKLPFLCSEFDLGPCKILRAKTKRNCNVISIRNSNLPKYDVNLK